MDSFRQSLQAWQMFYATVAAASATLTGLLFVSLSLNRERLKGDRAPTVLSTARRTFGDFLYVLMIGLVFLVPHQVPAGLTIALLALGLARGVGLVRAAAQHARTRARRIDVRAIVREVGFPLIATVGLIAVAIAIAFQATVAVYGLVIVLAALLVTACWNAWSLLIEE